MVGGRVNWQFSELVMSWLYEEGEMLAHSYLLILVAGPSWEATIATWPEEKKQVSTV